MPENNKQYITLSKAMLVIQEGKHFNNYDVSSQRISTLISTQNLCYYQCFAL